MTFVRRLMGAIDRWQRRTSWAGVSYAVVKKFGDDKANLFVVSLAWYGFTAIFPSLLVVVTVFGFVGASSLGTDVVSTLHEFPVIGSSFNPSSGDTLHGSVVGLVIGLIGLIYGAQGVMQTGQQTMATVWNVPETERTAFVPRLARSIAALATIGVAFVINAVLTTYVTGGTDNYAIRVPILVGLLVLNAGLYFLSFVLLTANAGPRRHLLPGACLAAVAFTALITVGTGLMTHQLKNASATYGAFGSVIGIVAFLLLLAKLTVYGAELNPVLYRRLYPRALPLGEEPSEADERVLRDLVRAQARRPDQAIGVGFGENAREQAAADAMRGDGADGSGGAADGYDHERAKKGWQPVFEADNIRDWRDHDVIDAGGSKIGSLEAIYVDTATDVPAFATVQIGLPGRRRLVFAPLAAATVGPGYVRVQREKKLVKDAPAIGTDGELAAGDEPAIFEHYGLTYQPGTGGERRLARR